MEGLPHEAITQAIARLCTDLASSEVYLFRNLATGMTRWCGHDRHRRWLSLLRSCSNTGQTLRYRAYDHYDPLQRASSVPRTTRSVAETCDTAAIHKIPLIMLFNNDRHQQCRAIVMSSDINIKALTTIVD
jgi:hypothetical protein